MSDETFTITTVVIDGRSYVDQKELILMLKAKGGYEVLVRALEGGKFVADESGRKASIPPEATDSPGFYGFNRLRDAGWD